MPFADWLAATSPQAWGREIHIIDLAGVCWHVRQVKAEQP
jgi:hypothetical protein